MTILGRRIRERRKALGLKQDELGKLVGVGKGTESNWETGKAEPKEPTLRELARALSVTVEWLRGGDPQVADAGLALQPQPPPPGVSGPEPGQRTTPALGASEGRSGPPARLVGLLELLVHQVDAHAPELLARDPGAWRAAAEHLWLIERFVAEQKALAEAAAEPAAEVVPFHAATRAEPGGGAWLRIGDEEEAGEEQETVGVRRYYRAAAGEPIDSERGPDEERVPAHFCRYGPRRCGVVQAVGDSMDEEGIADGDLVLFAACDKYSGGDMVVAQRVDPATEEPTGEHTIKRRRPDGKRGVWLFPQSSNPEHRVQHWGPGEERVMGVVLARRDGDGRWHPVHHRPAKDFLIPKE